jgi:formate dehydrogenase subunit delta
MDIDNLVHMANRIGDFFAAMPERAEAVDGVATHIKKFWEPRMRRQILEHLDKERGAGLSDLVREALSAHRAGLQP